MASAALGAPQLFDPDTSDSVDLNLVPQRRIDDAVAPHSMPRLMRDSTTAAPIFAYLSYGQ